MKEVNQEELLEALETKVEQHIAEAVRVFQNLPEAGLLQPAENGGWSIAQCLAHLNSYGDYYLPRIQAALARNKALLPTGTFKSTWLGNRFIRMMAPETGTKKYKAARQHLPADALDAPAVVGEFIRQQEELLACLRLARKSDLNAIRIPVSILKWVRLKLGDILQFMVVHNERHLLQAKRNLPAAKSVAG
ncbi:DinB family protein [Botryobacter ruber]|uniref:DinB family protein n=1 Tax=Botryobacter ruber TaxID=2171629 RepID=UPI000E0B4910|nr:DinB family protein [Botryobacter ruber]